MFFIEAYLGNYCTGRSLLVRGSFPPGVRHAPLTMVNSIVESMVVEEIPHWKLWWIPGQQTTAAPTIRSSLSGGSGMKHGSIFASQSYQSPVSPGAPIWAGRFL